MPDITMCLTETCPKRESCYRALPKPDQLQSYSDFTELCKDTDEYYWSVDGVDKLCKPEEWTHVGLGSFIN